MNRAFYIKRNGLFVPPRFEMNPAFLGSSIKHGSSGGGGGSDTPWLTITSSGSFRHDFDGVVGNTFTRNSAITITSLGRYVKSGSTQSHRIGIWDTGFTKLAEVTLNTLGLGNGFAYVALGTPLALSVGSYYFGSEEFSGGDFWFNDDQVTVTTTGVATITQSSFHSGSYDAPASGNNTGVFSFGVPNFLYH